MTNHPRYSPPPQQPGYHPGSDQRGAPGYSGHGQQQTYPQHYDWRYGQQPQYRQPNGSCGGEQAGRPASPPPPQLGVPRKRSRAGGLAVGALAIAVVSAGIGGAAASVIEHHGQLPIASDGTSLGGGTPSLPAANPPMGTVEQVAAKVVPSVVMLETDLGRQSEEGSGIILSSDGLILTNNHVVAASEDGPGGPGSPGGPGGPAAPGGPSGPPAGAQTKVTFADGRTTTFTIVGTDPSSDIAVVRAQGASGLTPITLGSSANLRVGQ